MLDGYETHIPHFRDVNSVTEEGEGKEKKAGLFLGETDKEAGMSGLAVHECRSRLED